MPPPAEGPRRTPSPAVARAAALAALLGATALAYAPALRGPFAYDDAHWIPALPGPLEVLRTVPGALVGRSRGVTDLTFALDRLVDAPGTLAFHLTSLAVHLALVLVLYALGRELLRRAGLDRPWVALAAAALFALHPLGSEAVAYVYQRSEAVSSLCYAGALWLMLRSERAPRPAGWIAAATALLLVGLGAKGVPVTAFAAYALVAFALPAGGGPPRPRAILARAAPWAAATVAFGVGLATHVQGHEDGGFAMPGLAPADYWLTQGEALLGYLRLALWPAGQSVDHDLAPVHGLEPAALAAWAGVAALAGLAAAGLARRRPPPVRVAALGLAWFLLLLAPTAAFPLADLFVEHRAYLALYGLALAAAALGAAALEAAVAAPRARAWAAVLLLAAVLGAFGAALAARARLWGDRVLLWADAVEQAPRKHRPHAGLGDACREAGDLDCASREFRVAAELFRDAAARGEVVMSGGVPGAVALGKRLLAAGRTREAVRVLEDTLPAAPAHPDTLAALAEALAATGQPGQAEITARAALWLDPTLSAAHAALAAALRAEGRPADALVELQRAAARGEPARLRALAAALAEAGRRPEACEVLGAAGGEGRADAAALGCP